MIKEAQTIEEIIEGCKKGDRKAQEQLYRSYYKAMAALCVRYSKNEQDALEMLNSGFYKVYKNIDKYDNKKAGIYTWIRTIIINNCLDFLKLRQEPSGWLELDQAASVDMPPDVFSKLSSAEILRLVRQLPPATQAVFNLYVMEGYNHPEIGKLVGISEGTSKWHLSEARKKLQKMIEQNS